MSHDLVFRSLVLLHRLVRLFPLSSYLIDAHGPQSQTPSSDPVECCCEKLMRTLATIIDSRLPVAVAITRVPDSNWLAMFAFCLLAARCCRSAVDAWSDQPDQSK